MVWFGLGKKEYKENKRVREERVSVGGWKIMEKVVVDVETHCYKLCKVERTASWRYPFAMGNGRCYDHVACLALWIFITIKLNDILRTNLTMVKIEFIISTN